MAECDGCGAHVTERYHAVFSSPDGGLKACIHCTTNPKAREAGLEEIDAS